MDAWHVVVLSVGYSECRCGTGIVLVYQWQCIQIRNFSPLVCVSANGIPDLNSPRPGLLWISVPLGLLAKVGQCWILLPSSVARNYEFKYDLPDVLEAPFLFNVIPILLHSRTSNSLISTIVGQFNYIIRRNEDEPGIDWFHNSMPSLIKWTWMLIKIRYCYS